MKIKTRKGFYFLCYYKNMNRESYDVIADLYNEYMKDREVANCIREFADLFNRGDMILDAGSGSGVPNDRYLVERGFIIEGIDESFKMIENARKNNPNVNYCLCDINEWKPDYRYDGIIAFDSLFHIDYDLQIQTFKRLSDLLKEDGYILFTHGKTDDMRDGVMFNEEFSYASLGFYKIIKVLNDVHLKPCKIYLNYYDINAGNRDLVVIARKY